MKKKILLLGLSALMLVPFAACGETEDSGETHNFVKHDEVAATCENAGNETYYTCSDCDKIFDAAQAEIAEIPVIEALGHDYVLESEVAGTCNTAGTVAHYTCDACDKTFDLLKNEITSVTGSIDPTNHASAVLIAPSAQPTKLTYTIGEAFDPTGMVVVYKCEGCEGEVVDNQFLTYQYQTQDATAFALGDTKVTVCYNGLSFDVEVTVGKKQAVISGVEASYQTSCGVAPIIEAVSNIPESDIVIEYFNGETKVTAADFVAGNTYTAKISIAETEFVLAAEVTANITVSHNHVWVETAENWQKQVCECACGDAKSCYVMNYQTMWVDEDDLALDLASIIHGVDEFSIKSIMKVRRLKGDGSIAEAKDGEQVAISGENEGMVYTFPANEYEDLTGYKPYMLTLAVTYEIDGQDVTLFIEAKLVDKLIKTADDLKVLAYLDGAVGGEGQTGVSREEYYVLMDDIDASSVVINNSNPAFQEGIGFRGTFEGNGYTISNLTVSGGQGLFGALGFNAKINNVSFTNVKVGSGLYALAFCARKAVFTNVSIEFALDSASYSVAYSANDCTFNNVSILTEAGVKPFLINEQEANEIPATVTINYFTQYTVSFDTDGGNEMADVKVTTGKKLAVPANPVKVSEDYDYEFLGWYYNNELWDFNTPITGDVELVAKWNATEKLNEEELIAAAENAIEALPASVNMPADVNVVPAIMSAKAAYDALSEEGKAQVANAEKLTALVAAIQGYSTVFVPSASGMKAIPAALHNPAPSVEATGAIATDAAQGTIYVSTAGEGGKAAIQFIDFPSVAEYDKLYFYVRLDVKGKLHMADGATNDGWGQNWINMQTGEIAANTWTLVEVEVSKGIFVSDWVMSVYATEVVNAKLEVGAIIGVKTAELPQKDTQEVSASILGTVADAGTTNDYGKVYNLTQGEWFATNNVKNTMSSVGTGAFANALPAGFDHFEFWIYNPTDTTLTFHLAGGVTAGDATYDADGDAWADSANFFDMASKAWTKVTISADDIAMNAQGQWYIYILGGDGAGATVSGWQVSSVYAVKA